MTNLNRSLNDNNLGYHFLNAFCIPSFILSALFSIYYPFLILEVKCYDDPYFTYKKGSERLFDKDSKS